jgi:hypothetical protein
LIDHGAHRHGKSGLRARAAANLTEVKAKIADLEIIRATLRAAVMAGCGRPHLPGRRCRDQVRPAGEVR